MSWQQIFQAIGAAGSNPYALIAFVVAVSGFVYTNVRFRRHKQLLKKLDSVPPDQRLEVIRTESGAHLKEGMTAEAWIKAKKQEYVFLLSLASIVLITVIALSIVPQLLRTRIPSASEQVAQLIESAGENSIEVKAVDSLADKVAVSACVALRPGEELHFLHAKTYEWSHDPLDTWEALAQWTGFAYPCGLVPGDALSPEAATAAIAKLQSELARVISEVQASGPLGDADAYINGIRSYVESVVAKLSDAQGAKVLWISTRDLADTEASKSAVRFWKRVLAKRYKDAVPHENRWVGPWFGVEGSGSHGERPPYPCTKASSSALIASVGTSKDGNFFSIGETVPFNRLGHRLKNTTNELRYVRFVINDERPKDNSEYGRCTLYVFKTVRE